MPVLRRAALALVFFVLSCGDSGTVAPPEPVDVRLSVTADTLLIGDTLRIVATVVTASGATVNRPVTWASSDNNVATVDATGRVLAHHAGIAVITARTDLATDFATITVDSAVAVRLSQTTATLNRGDELQLTAAIVGARGAQFTDRTVSWATSDSTIAVVSSSGRILARSPGTTSVTARFGTITGNAVITVAGVPVIRPVTCANRGVDHRGTVFNETWRVNDSPHFVHDTLTVTGNLVIESGATICGTPGALLRVTGSVSAIGEADRVIRIAATDTARRWGGILTTANGAVTIAHARIEHGDVTIGAFSTGLISDSHLRHASFLSAGNFSGNALFRSVVDTGNVVINRGGSFEDNIIRAGSLTLAASNQGSNTPTRLSGGRIENSPTTALTVGSTFSYRGPELSVGKPIRIVGSRGAPMVMPLHTFLNGWSTRAYQDSLLGNPNDTLSLYNVSTQPVDSINIRRDLPWRLLSLVPTLTVRKLTMEAGASLDVANVLLDITTGINLAGTPTLPITLKSTSTACWSSSPCSIGFSGTATSRLSNVVITNAMLNSSGSHVLHLDQVRANAAITLGSIGSSITNAVIEDVRVTSVGPNGALFLRASAVRAQNVMVRRTASPLAGVLIEGSNVEVLTCDVTDNVGDGIRILSGSGIQIHDCNLERNTGAGVNNQGTFLVDARRNWWGDPAGALGPNGDGVMGVVDHSEARLTRR